MIIDLQQGSPEWLDYRMSKIMATDARYNMRCKPIQNKMAVISGKDGISAS
jgi:hypothetical protein